MTEAEWLAETHPEYLLPFHRGKVSTRKQRLLAVAACRLVQHLITDEGSTTAVDVAERFADGKATEAERSAAETIANGASVEAFQK